VLVIENYLSQQDSVMITRKNSSSRDQADRSLSLDQPQPQERSPQPPMPPEPIASPPSRLLKDHAPLLQRLRLRTKVALCAVAISILPAVGMGMFQYSRLQSSNTANPDSELAQKNQMDARSLLFAYLGTAALTAILAGELAIFFTDRLTRSVLLAAKTARKLGQGHLSSRLAVQGSDELAVLATNLNWMADQFQAQLSQPSLEAQSIQLLKQTTLHLAQAQQVDESLKSVVQAVRQVFQFDRVLVYRVEPETGENLIAESVNSERISVMDIAIGQPWLKPTNPYSAEDAECLEDIAEAELPEQILRQLTALSVKASLTIPIVVKEQLVGVFIAHYCSHPHVWESNEVEVCSQLATQIGLAWERECQNTELTTLANQSTITAQAHQDQQKLLQTQLNDLLQTVGRAAKGDFTVRTAVEERDTATQEGESDPAATCDQIAIAFNQTLETVQEIAGQVKQSATQVETEVQANAQRLGQLDATTANQAETATQALRTIEDLMRALQATVAQVQQASPDLQGGFGDLDAKAQRIKQTGNELLKGSEVAAIPIKQVKRFGRDCQELTKRVVAANQLLVKINMLVLNASVLPLQTSGGMQGVSRMATQLAELSSQSSNAIQEIEQTILTLQHESDTVMSSLKQAVSFISLGKDFVALSDQQLEQTQVISNQIQQLIQSISSTTETQIQTTQTVLDWVQKLSSGSQAISGETRAVEESLQAIVRVTQQLQTSIESLK
jgi:twitching motility protein PilJ